MMPLGAPSISKYGSLVRPDAQIVALRAHCARTARALRLRLPLRTGSKIIQCTILIKIRRLPKGGSFDGPWAQTPPSPESQQKNLIHHQKTQLPNSMVPKVAETGQPI